MNQLTRFGLNVPEIRRFSVGYDTLFDSLVSGINSSVNAGNYPPFNIIKKGDDAYCIELAVAGFKRDEIEINLERHVLTVTGSHADTQLPEGWESLHAGISSRSFSRQFTLAEHIVVNGATYEDGILTINLAQIVPEELKPKRIQIACNSSKK